jgi:polyhydroxyalkanoate synthase
VIEPRGAARRARDFVLLTGLSFWRGFEGFYTSDDLTSDAKVWLKGSDLHEGTWWTDVGVWLDAHCGGDRPAPQALGSSRLPVLAEAPGTYVFDK